MKGTVGYAIDGRADVVKSGTGLCWRTGYWTPAMAIEECDPDLVKKVAPMAAPAKAAPAPAPAPVAAEISLGDVLNFWTICGYTRLKLAPPKYQFGYSAFC